MIVEDNIPIWIDEDDTPLLNNFYIYCYKNKTNGKCYVGKTNNLIGRKYKHRWRAFVENSPLSLYNALRKYGEDNFEFIILDSFYSEDIIFDIEKFYIKAYKSNQTEFGYNLSEGGEGSSGVRHNENQIRANKMKMGSKNGNSKLTEDSAIAVFDDYKSENYSMSELAMKYNISLVSIERLLSGRSWKHLNLDIESLKNIVSSNGRNFV